MSTTEDTSAIDEKKSDDPGTFTPDFKGFTMNYVSSIIFTICVSIFIIGGLGLYTTKVAQSSILPDNIELAPYTIFDRIVKPIPIDINVMRPSLWADNTDTVSQKAIFNSQEYLDSFSNSFLCSIKKNADPKVKANAPLFFSRVYDNIVAKNFLVINTIFFYLSYLPEYLIMILYGFFGIFIWMGLYFFNVCISIFYHFVNIPELFRESFNPDEKKPDIFEWEGDDNVSFIRFFKFLMFFFIWIPVGLISTFLMPIFFTVYGLIAPLLATYTISKTKKSYNVLDFIKDTFAYKKLFFFILSTLSLLSNGFRFLGTNSLIGILIALVFAYYMGLYTNEIPSVGDDGFTSKIRETLKRPIIEIDKTKLVKICQPIPINKEKINNIIINTLDKSNFRKVTKPKNIGGSDDMPEDSDSTVAVEPGSVAVEPTTVEPTTVEPGSVEPTTVEPTTVEPTTVEPPAVVGGQKGGKKKHSFKTTKKYNIRLV